MIVEGGLLIRQDDVLTRALLMIMVIDATLCTVTSS